MSKYTDALDGRSNNDRATDLPPKQKKSEAALTTSPTNDNPAGEHELTDHQKYSSSPASVDPGVRSTDEAASGSPDQTPANAAKYSGLSPALLYELIKEKCIISSTVLRPGRRRGRRLIQRSSLDAFIEKGIGKKSVDNIRGEAPESMDPAGEKGGAK